MDREQAALIEKGEIRDKKMNSDQKVFLCVFSAQYIYIYNFNQ